MTAISNAVVSASFYRVSSVAVTVKAITSDLIVFNMSFSKTMSLASSKLIFEFDGYSNTMFSTSFYDVV